jgi:molecular chaperone DnaK (HSP70)
MAPTDDIILGIDLGTTFSAMAIVDVHGKSAVLPNSEGHPTTPSVVHFYEPGACVVGEEAVKTIVADPENAVQFVKRLMGEEGVSLQFHGEEFTPQAISALILKKLREDAEEALGVPVRKAVISVPAYFNSAQRAATAEAGKMAGLDVLSMINEPTAAAIAHGLEHFGKDRRLLVFDLGGGTFDVTIMDIEGITFKTVASDGDARLGGKDWDDRLLNYVASTFAAKFGADPRDDPQPYQELYQRCIAAKLALSTKPRASIPVNHSGNRTVIEVTQELFEGLTSDLVDRCAATCSQLLEREKLSWTDIDEVLLVGGSTRMPMIRQRVLKMAGQAVAPNINPDECVAIGSALAGVLRHHKDHPALRRVRQGLADAARARQTADPVVTLEDDSVEGEIPGGEDETRVSPTVVEAVEEAPPTVGPSLNNPPVIPPLPPPPISEDEEERTDPGIPAVEIQDASTHPLGVVALGEDLEPMVVKLIPAATTIPCERRGRFAYAYDGMTAVQVEICEGYGNTPEEVTIIGKVILADLPPRPRGTPIDVVYRYTVDARLEIDVLDVETGASLQAEVLLTGSIDSDELEQAHAQVSDTEVR